MSGVYWRVKQKPPVGEVGTLWKAPVVIGIRNQWMQSSESNHYTWEKEVFLLHVALVYCAAGAKQLQCTFGCI